jgi:hypothetical protein
LGGQHARETGASVDQPRLSELEERRQAEVHRHIIARFCHVRLIDKDRDSFQVRTSQTPLLGSAALGAARRPLATKEFAS